MMTDKESCSRRKFRKEAFAVGANSGLLWGSKLFRRPFYGEIRGAMPEAIKASMLLDCVTESRCADVTSNGFLRLSTLQPPQQMKDLL